MREYSGTLILLDAPRSRVQFRFRHKRYHAGYGCQYHSVSAWEQASGVRFCPQQVNKIFEPVLDDVREGSCCQDLR
jgi:hypothetical protein